MVRSLAFASALFLLAAGMSAAQEPNAGAPSTTGGASVSGSHRIRLTYRGLAGPHVKSDGTCPGADPAKSTDVFEGTVRGNESSGESEGLYAYFGDLKRTTKLEICDLKPAPDIEWDYCATHLQGHGTMRVKIEIQTDRPTGYFTLEWKGNRDVDSVSGSCEQTLTDEIGENYLVDGEGGEFELKKIGPLRDGEAYLQPSRGPGDPIGPWTLEVLGRQGLKAIPGGPYPIERAATVTLDGSRSTPESGHTIQTYSWNLTPLGTPEGCAGIGAPKTMTGATVSFVGLCSVKAKLTVTQDDGAVDAQETEVTVSPRAWRTKLTTDPTPNFQNFTFVANGFVFGYNRCSRDGHFDEDKNHWYEPRAGSTTDYEEGTYWFDQVTDDGPFAGIFFVSKKDVDVKRGFWVNKRLTPNGDVYDLNPGAERSVVNCSGNPAQCKFGKPVIERLEASVEAHEKLHSELAAAAVAGAKDPAIGVEKSLGSNRAALKDSVNLLVTTAVSDMTLASSEENVKARMRNGPFRDGGCIDFPAWDGAIRGCYFHFVTFADKGERDMAP